MHGNFPAGNFACIWFCIIAAYDLVALLGSAALLFIFSATNHKITRMEGAMMLIMLGVYYTLVLMA